MWFDHLLSWLYIWKLWGSRCPSYQPGCQVCERWAEHDWCFNDGPHHDDKRACWDRARTFWVFGDHNCHPSDLRRFVREELQLQLKEPDFHELLAECRAFHRDYQAQSQRHADADLTYAQPGSWARH
jgi:hypothetical protein